MSICIISCERLFARMLELELLELSANVKAITEKLNPPALKLAAADADLIVFDAQYYSSDISFIEQINKPFVIITKTPLAEEAEAYDNITAVFERPFSIEDFIKHISTQSVYDVRFPTQQAPGSIGNIELDHFSKQATINGKIFKFSHKEFSMLSLLYKNRGRVVSRKTVLETVWGNDYDPSNNVDNVYISYLRKKLDDKLGVKLIYTIRGKGYMLK